MTASDSNGQPEIPAPEAQQPKGRTLKQRVLRWSLIGLGGLVGLIVLAGALLYVRGRVVLNRTYDVSGVLASVPTDSASVFRGEHLALIHGCQQCHGERLEGAGFVLDIPPGLIVPPNLTRGAGGVGSGYSALDWDRAVRYGVRPDRKAVLPFMPYQAFSRLNDADMAALASYLASRPAVDNRVASTKLSILGYIVFGASGIPRDGLDDPRPIITPGPTPEYGAYLASTTCVTCHGPRLQGVKPAPTLTGYAAMDVTVLTRALRTGIAADGRTLGERMPWQAFSNMYDYEIAALHQYIRSLGDGE